MIPANRIPAHPGKILKEKFLDDLGISQVAFAAHIQVPVQRVNEIIRGKRGITPETAWLLAQSLDTTPEFSTTRRPTTWPCTARRKASRGFAWRVDWAKPYRSPGMLQVKNLFLDACFSLG
jgi:addiction module HigA family antidote